MIISPIERAVSASSYPGRGIVIGRSQDGLYAVCAYFIMGRSVNSRNRVFVRDADGLRTRAHDESKMSDPSLVIYAPVRVLGKRTIVTNGDQTDTVYDALGAGGTFEGALRTRTFEPDPPNYTPRISGLIDIEGELVVSMSILKSADGDPAGAQRYFYEYEHMAPGEARFIHTYAMDGDPLPSFEGEPERVALTGGLDEVTDAIWNHLDSENKVSLFVRFIDLATGAYQDTIKNKLQ